MAMPLSTRNYADDLDGEGAFILIAEDEPDTVVLLERICARAGFDVETARDGITALELTRELRPDLVLLDIMMPRMNGFEVLERLRADEATWQIPVIILTAAARAPSDAARGIEIGADDYMSKPFNHHELIARMRSKIKARRLEESLQRRTDELEILVKLGVDLNRPLDFETLAEKLLRFLTNELTCHIALLQVYASNTRPGLSLILRDGKLTTAKYVEDVPQSDANDEAYFVEGDDAAKLFNDISIRNGIVTPLQHHHEDLGLIAIGHTEQTLSEDDLRVMRSISKQASLAMRNAQLYVELRHYAAELEDRVEARTNQLKTTQDQLLRSEKLASLGRLAGEIAHEINNPLQPIMTLLEDAIEDLEDDRKIEVESLEIAMSEVKRMKSLVQNLLDFAKPDTKAGVDIFLGDLIRKTMSITRKLLQKKHIELKMDLKGAGHTMGNPDQLKQVFVNMAINASDAMTPKGKGNLDIIMWEDDQFVHVIVKDTGVGIEPEQLSQIFEPFFSTKKDGSGLGLAITHSIIEAHGGLIDVRSEVGVGTEFQISLPLVGDNI